MVSALIWLNLRTGLVELLYLASGLNFSFVYATTEYRELSAFIDATKDYEYNATLKGENAVMVKLNMNAHVKFTNLNSFSNRIMPFHTLWE